jgi:hypothetical protein
MLALAFTYPSLGLCIFENILLTLLKVSLSLISLFYFGCFFAGLLGSDDCKKACVRSRFSYLKLSSTFSFVWSDARNRERLFLEFRCDSGNEVVVSIGFLEVQLNTFSNGFWITSSLMLLRPT